ncbi:MAG: chemotaxis protein CheW [Candidatus Kapabacteria bacterium]|nr:chemotaxis protein CheW [Ignavibacteriota bacterium]MCW5885453.1 chemotaxis protein CheW [Candidatus Kapabacteria bacterium]
MANLNDTYSKEQKDDILQLVSFNIGEEEFGVDILKVQEIIRLVEITRVPNAPHFVEGVINLRGKVIPVIDLRKRLGMVSIESSVESRIVVVELENKIIGFLVDCVNEVLRISRSITEPPPAIIAGINADYITAIGKLEDRILILLDLEMILNTNEKQSLTNLESVAV